MAYTSRTSFGSTMGRVIGLCLAGMLISWTLSSRQAWAQQFHIGGGPSWMSQVRTPDSGYWVPNYWLGVRVYTADMFQFGASIGYNQMFVWKGRIALRPWYEKRRLDLYAYLEYGRYYPNDERSALAAVGLGGEYQITPQVGVYVEVDKRWSAFHTYTAEKIRTGWGPRVGLSFQFNRSNTSSPAQAMQTAASNATEQETSPADPAGDTTFAASSPAGSDGPRFGQAIVDPNKFPEMHYVPGGVFTMGLTDADPLNLQTAGIKRVSVTPFFMDKYEVSNKEYRAFLSELPPEEREAMLPDSSVWMQVHTRHGWTAYFRSKPFENFPVIGVNWIQARAYCQAHTKRLPTEAEWEYAARAGHTGRIYPWEGHDVRNDQGRYMANFNPGRPGYADDGWAFTAPVGTYPPNDWGLYNMSGNVAEWTMDAYTPTFGALSDFNPLYRDSTEVRRTIRGGSWASSAFYLGVGVRDALPRDQASPYVGFRCVRDIGVMFMQEPPVQPPAPADTVLQEEMIQQISE